VDDRIGDELAGQQFRVGKQIVAAWQLPGCQRLPDEAARGGYRSRLGIIGCGRDEIHMSSRCRRSRSVAFAES
jgi:hypothetical protein